MREDKKIIAEKIKTEIISSQKQRKISLLTHVLKKTLYMI